MAVGAIKRSPCNKCGHDTDHEVLSVETVASIEYPDSDYWKLDEVVQCRGCREIAIRHEEWWRDRIPDPDPEISGSKRTSLTFSPYRLWRRPPEWLDQIQLATPDLHGLLVEVYSATNDDQVRLLAMGVRGAVDYVMTQRIGDDGGFKAKLKKMVEAGHLTTSQSETLWTVIDAGSAAAHRGFMPSRPLLVEMVVTMETLIRELYISGPMMDVLKKHIPPRP